MDLKPASLKRYGHIARLLFKYGGSTRADLTLPDDQESPELAGEAARGEALAADLEALGPTFIKLGQLLSSRGALIPPAYADALERLQDSVEPFAYAEVERIVTEELGVRISKGFQSFDPEPVASASLGQVHRAPLRDGREVVVKVQRQHRQRITRTRPFNEMPGYWRAHRAGRPVNLGKVLEESPEHFEDWTTREPKTERLGKTPGSSDWVPAGPNKTSGAPGFFREKTKATRTWESSPP